MPLRVVVWGTGWVGSKAIAAIARRPDMKLVGVWVHSPEKAGVDAGVLAGGSSLGLPATTDIDALIALAPDCICYAASGPGGSGAAEPDYVRFLVAGINVVTVSSAGLVYPAGFDPAAVDVLEVAALAGGASLYASGIEPGFAADQFVLTMLTMSEKIRSVRIQELFAYDSYPVEYMMREVFGFGQAMDHVPLMSYGGAQSGTWGPSVRMIADALGVKLDGIRETYDRVLTDRRLEVASGVIEAGTVGAVRFETIGVVDGRDAIIIEHVNRMSPDVAPQWPSAERDGTYRVLIDGDPKMQCDLTLGDPETASQDGMLATTMRIVNAIPAVCAARPGLLHSLELPLTLPVDPF